MPVDTHPTHATEWNGFERLLLFSFGAAVILATVVFGTVAAANGMVTVTTGAQFLAGVLLPLGGVIGAGFSTERRVQSPTLSLWDSCSACSTTYSVFGCSQRSLKQ